MEHTILFFFMLISITFAHSEIFLGDKQYLNDEITLADVPYTMNYYETKLNNFEFGSSATFKIRYLVADSYYKPGGPILFYCGNEGSIFEFWDNFGFIKQVLAEHFNALVIFAEHRFFGESYPSNPEENNNKYLTSEQALQDYIHLIQKFKKENAQYKQAKVIAFGGSYGGMLSAWARMKYPNVFSGSIASSAPILLFGKPHESFYRIITDTFTYYNPQCSALIKEGFNVLNEIGQNSTQADIELLNLIFPGNNLNNNGDVINLSQNILPITYFYMSEFNYPYPTKFFGTHPANPAKRACESINYDLDINNKTELLYVLRNSTSIINDYNSTQNIRKFKNYESTTSGWDYLSCTEMVMPTYTDGIHDMFIPTTFDYEAYQQGCVQEYGTDVRPYYIFDTYGGRDPNEDFKGYSNIFFVNGQFDPWRAGCVSEPFNNSTHVFEAVSAHHLDLFTPNPLDPPSIIKARELEIEYITKWMNE